METAITIWLIGFLYTCGQHLTAKEKIKEAGKENEVADAGWLEYLVLFFGWPHYLGYR